MINVTLESLTMRSNEVLQAMVASKSYSAKTKIHARTLLAQRKKEVSDETTTNA